MRKLRSTDSMWKCYPISLSYQFSMVWAFAARIIAHENHIPMSNRALGINPSAPQAGKAVSICVRCSGSHCSQAATPNLEFHAVFCIACALSPSGEGNLHEPPPSTRAAIHGFVPAGITDNSLRSRNFEAELFDKHYTARNLICPHQTQRRAFQTL